MNWREISVNTDKIAAEAVSDILIECGAGGVAIEDPVMINQRIAENVWDAFAFPDELLNRNYVTVKAYFPRDHKLAGRIRQLKERLCNLQGAFTPDPVKGIDFSDVREEDWANSWKAYYKPVQVSERIVIKPTWESYCQAPEQLVIELDPGMAFGTGTHPTTTMCIKSLEKIIKGGENVFDIGTGSGILSIVAAKLGAGAVKAVDMDEVAVEAARENVNVNGVGHIVEVTAGNLLDGVQGTADVVAANIIADVIIRLCPDAAKVVKTGGRFVASGIIAARAEEVLKHIKQQGFVVEEVTREGEWVSLVAVRED
ncbi:MAG: 50S ribosomal protein L11 methyltransferase [Eubacteriales bacterium]